MPIYMDRHDIEGATAKEKVKQLHEEAHGMIPHKIMEVNPDTVEAFLGRIEDPQPPSESLTPSSEAFVDLTNLCECMKFNGRRRSEPS